MSPSNIGGLLHGITRGSRSADRARYSRRAIHSPWLEALETRALLSITNVHVVNFSFAPATVTINIGDTVHWIWDTDMHTTTSVTTSDVQWNSGTLDTGATFDVTFNQAGNFNYYCKFHGQDLGGGNTSGMAGTIRVLAPLASIAVTPANPSLPKGETQHFIATGTLTDNSTVNLTNSVTWSSSSLAIASISNAAGSNGAAAGLAPGTTTITATSGTISGSTSLTVTAAVLQSISVSPPSATIAIGSTQQFTATGILSDQTAEDLTNLVTWTSSAPSIASVSASGLATAQSAGSTAIGVSFQGISGSATLTVAAPPPPLVTIVSIAPVLNKKRQVTSIKVVLSGLVNPSEAQAKNIYRLLVSSKNNAFVAKKAKPIAVKSARYSPATNTIVITPKTLFTLAKPVQLSISGGPPIGLEDSLGRFIDGDRNGIAGGSEVAVISKKSVKI